MSELPSWLTDKDTPRPKYPRLEFATLRAKSKLPPPPPCAFRDLKEEAESGFTRDLTLFSIVAPLFNDIPFSTFDKVTFVKVKSQPPQKESEPAVVLSKDDSVEKSELLARKLQPKKLQTQSNDQNAGSRRQSTTEDPHLAAPNAQLSDSAIAEADEKIVKEIDLFHEKSRRMYREKRFLSITKCKELSNYCICCGFSPPNRVHPIFRYAGLCSYCEGLLKKLPDVIDPRDGYHANCTICCRQGLNLCMCDSGPDKCIKSYCFRCLDLFLGVGGAQKITSLKKWNCILCTQENLGLLQVRSQWKQSYDKFMINGAKINSKIIAAVSNRDSCSSKSSVQSDSCQNEANDLRVNEEETAKDTEKVLDDFVQTEQHGRAQDSDHDVTRRVPNSKDDVTSRTLDKERNEDIKEGPLDNQVEIRGSRDRLFSVFSEDEDDVTLADLGFSKQNGVQKENMLPEQHSPAGSDIANNNCLPAACDQNLPLCKSITTAAGANFALTDNRGNSSLESPTVSIKPKSRSRVDISSVPFDSSASVRQLGVATSIPKTRVNKPNTTPLPSPPTIMSKSRSKRFEACTSSYHLRKLCLCCTSKNVVISHPIFVGGVCEECLPKVTKNLISILDSAAAVATINGSNDMDEELEQLDLDYLKAICCICCSSSKKLLRCTQPNCDYAYCEQCISGLVSSDLFEYLCKLSLTKVALENARCGGKTAPGWSCFLCCDSQYHGLLKLQI